MTTGVGRIEGAMALLLALCLVLSSAGPAGAAALSVTPTRLSLAPSDRSGAVTVSNTSDEPTMIQIRGYDWKDDPSISALAPTQAMLAVPTVATLAPGARQVVRVALRRPLQGTTEASYRLVISEVPTPERLQTGGVFMAVSFSLPVFITPPGAEPDPRFRFVREAGDPALTIVNAGSAHLHLRGLRLVDATSGETLHDAATGAYVLPGRTHRWPLPADVPERAALQVDIVTAQGVRRYDVAR